MPGNLNHKQREERINFILSRTRAGLSRAEIERQFSEHYKVQRSQTKHWYKQSMDSLIAEDPNERQQARIAMLEFLYAQLVGSQQDLATISAEIQKVDDWWEQRTMISERLLSPELSVADRQRLRQEMSHIPKLKPELKTSLIEQKFRGRERIVRLASEIGKIQGLYVQDMPWMQAVQVLLDNNLLPVESAERMLNLLQEFNSKISVEVNV